MPASRAAKAARPQIPALTGLRFFAAFFILFAHSADWLAQFQDSDIRTKFSFVAMYGMPLFFVLSGFVIHYNYGLIFREKGPTEGTLRFLGARISRLLPLYFFTLIISMFADDFIVRFVDDFRNSINILIHNITLTQTWFYITVDEKHIANMLFPMSWSISTEFFFYLSYIPVVYLILSIRSPTSSAIISILYATVVMISIFVIWNHIDDFLNFAKSKIPNYLDIDKGNDSYFRWLFYFSPYFRVFEFFMGCLASHCVILLAGREVNISERRFALGALIVSLLMLVSFGALYIDLVSIPGLNDFIKHLSLNFLCAPAIGYILFYVGRYDSAFTRFLSSPKLVSLGETSYSIYLVHTWTIPIFAHAAQPFNALWATEAVCRVLCAIAVTLLLSYATYRVIEVPARRFLRRKFDGAIAAVLARSEPAPRRPGATAGIRVFAFSAATAITLAAIVIIGQPAPSHAIGAKIHRLVVGDRPEIEVVSATYGMSCKDFKVPAPFPHAVADGNATKPVRTSCEGEAQCSFMVLASRIGDPANSCGKDFSVEYRCAGSGDLRKATLPAEADGKSVVLDCRPTASG